MSNGNDNQSGSVIPVTRLSVPLVLVAGVFCGLVALPYYLILDRVGALEQRTAPLILPVAATRLDALERRVDRNDTRSVERHKSQDAEINRLRERLAELERRELTR